MYDVSVGVQGNVIPSVSLAPPHMDGVESLAYSTKNNVLFSSSRDKSIKKWDMSKKTVIKVRKVLMQLDYIKKNQIFIISRYYAEMCNEWLGLSLLLSACEPQLRKNVATMASRWRYCVRFDRPWNRTPDRPRQ